MPKEEMETDACGNSADKKKSIPCTKKVSGIKQNSHEGDVNFNIKNQKSNSITEVKNVDQVAVKGDANFTIE